MSSSPALQNVTEEDFARVSDATVMLEYFGESEAAITIKGPVNRNVTYRFGRQRGHNIKKVFASDAKVFLGQRNRDGSPVFKVYDSERLPHQVLEFLRK